MVTRDELATKVHGSLQLRNMVKGIPNNFKFSKNGAKLYFTGLEHINRSKFSLYYTNIPTPANEETSWKLLANADTLEKVGVKLSKEEELLRERQRTVTTGINSFICHEDSQRFLVPTSGALYIINSNGQAREIPNKGNESRLDPKWSSDGTKIAYIKDSNLFVYDLELNEELQVTDKETGVLNGQADFIAQEEFDRFTAYWWTPKHVESNTDRILYLRTDERHVREYRMTELDSIEGITENARYPLSGESNSISTLCIAEISEDGKIAIKHLQPSLKDRFPDTEYVVRCGWADDKNVWAQVLDRKQENLILVKIGIDQFTSLESNQNPCTHTIITKDSSDTWINVHNLLYFFEDGSGRVLWCNESVVGFRHIYLIDPAKSETRPITLGEWQVDDEFLEVDNENELVYFIGSKDSPLEQHLYVASFAVGSNPNLVVRLTEPNYSHSVSIAVTKEKTLFVTKFSNIDTPPQVAVYEVLRSKAQFNFHVSKIMDISNRSSRFDPLIPLSKPQIHTFQNSIGLESYCAVFLPTNGAKPPYKTILHVYAGPHVQLVTNDYEKLIMRYTKIHLWNYFGFAVVLIDGVGSIRRGLKFESPLKYQMGMVELKDQVAGLSSLIEKGLVDPARIAITGWSYGGYISLMALCQRPDFFKKAIACAPVTVWEAYDTGYTERYMGTPESNQEGYKRGSVISHLKGFPDEEGRLLLVHGLKDENVHFCHTTILLNALIGAWKPYQLYIYPSERHGIRGMSSYIHLELKFLSFLEDM